MKVKDVENTLGLMEGLIEKLQNNQEIKDLIGYYDFLAKNSGYHFSDDDPNDIRKMLEQFLGDTERIREDMASAVNDHGQELEV